MGHQRRKRRREFWEFVVAVATFLVVVAYTIVTGFMWRATDKSAEAAESAARTSQSALVRSNRPWVGVTGTPTISQPFGITDTEIHFRLNITVKNYGPSPALHVNTDTAPEITVVVPDTPKDFFKQSQEASDAACTLADMNVVPHLGAAAIGGKVEQIMMPPFGVTVFPGDTTTVVSNVSAGDSAIGAFEHNDLRI
jgi:hypothetical protein